MPRRWSMALVDDEETEGSPVEGEESEPAGAPTVGRFHSLMVVEDAWSGDYRFINSEALTWRDLPLPLMATDESDHGALVVNPTVQIGMFDRIERQGAEIHGYGSFLTEPDEQAANLIAMVQRGELRWFSVDMDEVVAELMLDMGPTGESEPEAAAAMEEDDEEDELLGMPEGESETVDGHEYLVIPLPTDRYRVTSARLMGGTAVPFPAFQEALIEPDDGSEPEAEQAALVASAIPVFPPDEWFDELHLTEVTPWTITDDGEIIGHLAAWNSCHIGMPGCQPPPHSYSNYAHFLVGEIRTASGSRVPVGHIALKGGHADLRLSPREAQAHYDNPATAFCDVTVGEDEHGIWLHGALRPGLDPASIRVAMAHDVSGDWRQIGTHMELIGICSVNVPGFHKPRVATYTKGGMVASAVFCQPLVATARSEVLQRRAVERIAASIGRSFEQRRAVLHARVHADA